MSNPNNILDLPDGKRFIKHIIKGRATVSLFSKQNKLLNRWPAENCDWVTIIVLFFPKAMNKKAYEMLRALEYIKAAEKITGLKRQEAYPKALDMFKRTHWGLQPFVDMKEILKLLYSLCKTERVGKYQRVYDDE
jgi:hypothetical protein